MDMLHKLRAEGWYLTDSGLRKVLAGAESTDLRKLVATAMNMDFRDIAGGALATKRDAVDSIAGNVVLQVQKVRNISAPKANEESKTAPRFLQLDLSDGQAMMQALEVEVVPELNLNVAPGTKIRLGPDRVQLMQGFITLRANCVKVLGGRVDALYEKWEVARTMQRYARSGRRMTDSSGPPPWIPFGNKLDALKESLPQERNFKSLLAAAGGGDRDKDTKENDEFNAMRTEAIAVATKAGAKKIFGGGGQQILDYNVKKILEKGYSEEEAKQALRSTHNNLERALYNLKRRQEYNRRSDDMEETAPGPSHIGGRSSSRGALSGGPREAGGGGRRHFAAAKEEATAAKPAANVSLFDFLTDKLQSNSAPPAEGSNSYGVSSHAARANSPPYALERYEKSRSSDQWAHHGYSNFNRAGSGDTSTTSYTSRPKFENNISSSFAANRPTAERSSGGRDLERHDRDYFNNHQERPSHSSHYGSSTRGRGSRGGRGGGHSAAYGSTNSRTAYDESGLMYRSNRGDSNEITNRGQPSSRPYQGRNGRGGYDRERERDRGERMERGERGERHDRLGRGDRHRVERGERMERGDRGERGERMERGERGDRMERGDRGERMERGERGERIERGDRGDRMERGERGERIERGDRGERMERGERGDRMERGDRHERPDRGDRGERPDRGDRGERPDRGDRGERPERGARADRVDRAERTDRAERAERGGDGRHGRGGRGRYGDSTEKRFAGQREHSSSNVHHKGYNNSNAPSTAVFSNSSNPTMHGANNGTGTAATSTAIVTANNNNNNHISNTNANNNNNDHYNHAKQMNKLVDSTSKMKIEKTASRTRIEQSSNAGGSGGGGTGGGGGGRQHQQPQQQPQIQPQQYTNTRQTATPPVSQATSQHYNVPPSFVPQQQQQLEHAAAANPFNQLPNGYTYDPSKIIGFQSKETNDLAMTLLKSQGLMSTMTVQALPQQPHQQTLAQQPLQPSHAYISGAGAAMQVPAVAYGAPTYAMMNSAVQPQTVSIAPALPSTSRFGMVPCDTWVWKIGDLCLAKYWDDDRYYEAEVTAVANKTCVVFFMGYGNYEEVLKTDCLPITDSNNRPINNLACAAAAAAVAQQQHQLQHLQQHQQLHQQQLQHEQLQQDQLQHEQSVDASLQLPPGGMSGANSFQRGGGSGGAGPGGRYRGERQMYVPPHKREN